MMDFLGSRTFSIGMLVVWTYLLGTFIVRSGDTWEAINLALIGMIWGLGLVRVFRPTGSGRSEGEPE